MLLVSTLLYDTTSCKFVFYKIKSLLDQHFITGLIESYEGKLRSVLRREVGVLLKALTPAVLESDPNSLVRSRDKSPIEASGMEA